MILYGNPWPTMLESEVYQALNFPEYVNRAMHNMLTYVIVMEPTSNSKKQRRHVIDQENSWPCEEQRSEEKCKPDTKIWIIR